MCPSRSRVHCVRVRTDEPRTRPLGPTDVRGTVRAAGPALPKTFEIVEAEHIETQAGHVHVTSVGVLAGGFEPIVLDVEAVLEGINRGIEYHVLGRSGEWIAVYPLECECGFETICSSPYDSAIETLDDPSSRR